MFYEDAFGRLCDLGAQYDLSVNLEFVTWSGVKDLNAAVGAFAPGEPSQSGYCAGCAALLPFWKHGEGSGRSSEGMVPVCAFM